MRIPYQEEFKMKKKVTKIERYDAYQSMIDAKVLSQTEPKIDYRQSACAESFQCKVCGTIVMPDGAGSRHRNHCPKCLSSVHEDNDPGDRASLCKGIMEPVSVWVRKGGEWAIIHRCRTCGTLSSNRIAADDNPALLMSIAVKPLAMTPFPLNKLDELFGQ
ncbi:GTPase EngC [[Clostridium] saccharolyticum WM1]|uniref:GTPase EngC n=2 Tax=Lacrimispora TaxID=2719231 RepID=D9QZB3_LACSW|nr:GTPase EngC [[Clostridium] saccharolyticum WM1]QRV22047.1 RNHCP domain-containing protein [Lacrimispora saccharolytica]